MKVSINATRSFNNGESTNIDTIPVAISGTVENVSKRRLYLEPTRLWVTGERLTPRVEPRHFEPDDESLLQGGRDMVWDKYLRSEPEVIQVTNTLASEWSLSPAEVATFSEVA